MYRDEYKPIEFITCTLSIESRLDNEFLMIQDGRTVFESSKTSLLDSHMNNLNGIIQYARAELAKLSVTTNPLMEDCDSDLLVDIQHELNTDIMDFLDDVDKYDLVDTYEHVLHGMRAYGITVTFIADIVSAGDEEDDEDDDVSSNFTY